MPSTKLSQNFQNETWAEIATPTCHASVQEHEAMKQQSEIVQDRPRFMKVEWARIDNNAAICSLVCGQFANREEDLLLNGHLCDFLAPWAVIKPHYSAWRPVRTHKNGGS